MRDDLKGKVAVVLGGSKGIGKAISLKLAACGAQVIVGARNQAPAEEVIKEAKVFHGIEPVFIPFEMMEYPSIAHLMANVKERYGKIDIAVNSGGSNEPRPELFHQVDPELYPGYFHSRFFPRVYAIRAAFNQMQDQGFGKIINLTSDAGRVPTPSESMVGAAAAAVIFLTRALGKEFARWGIRINTISTTLTVGTRGYENYRQKAEQDSSEVLAKAFKKLESKVPFGLNRPEDIAELALYLASDASNQLSGATISINGGASFP